MQSAGAQPGPHLGRRGAAVCSWLRHYFFKPLTGTKTTENREPCTVIQYHSFLPASIIYCNFCNAKIHFLMTWWPSSLPEYELETLETRQGENLLLPVKYCNCALGKSRILTQRVRLLSGAAQAHIKMVSATLQLQDVARVTTSPWAPTLTQPLIIYL